MATMRGSHIADHQGAIGTCDDGRDGEAQGADAEAQIDSATSFGKNDRPGKPLMHTSKADDPDNGEHIACTICRVIEGWPSAHALHEPATHPW
jgi:hypothetical protein